MMLFLETSVTKETQPCDAESSLVLRVSVARAKTRWMRRRAGIVVPISLIVPGG